MKIHFLLAGLFFLPGITCLARQDTCKIGIYINSLYDFDLEDKSFVTDCWIWKTYRNDSLRFKNFPEVPGSKSVEFSHYDCEKKAGQTWVTQKCKAKIMHDWNLARFPFDKQVLRIELEDSEFDTSRLIYVADSVNSRLDSSFNSKEWLVDRFSVRSEVYTYTTTYGDPLLSGTSTYPRLVAEISIRRNNSWLMLAKMLTGAYVAFLISCLALFVSSKNQDSRFGLCVGGLFTAIGNKYIVESAVSASATNTLMDNVHNITFLFILLIVGIIILSLKLFETGNRNKIEKSVRLDTGAFFGISFLYLLVNFSLIYAAIVQ